MREGEGEEREGMEGCKGGEGEEREGGSEVREAGY